MLDKSGKGLSKLGLALDQVWPGIGVSSRIGYFHFFLGDIREQKGAKYLIGKEVAVTRLSHTGSDMILEWFCFCLTL